MSDLGENKLQQGYEDFLRQLDKSYPPVIEATLKNIYDGMDYSKAVDKAFKNTYYLQTLENNTVNAVIGSSQLGLGAKLTLDSSLVKDYYLFTEFQKGMTLHDSIWGGDAQKAVKKVVNDYLQYKGNVVSLTNKIKNAATPQAEISNIIKKLLNISKNDPSVESAIKQAQRYTKTLTSRGYPQNRVRPAYEKIIKAVEANDKKALKKAVEYAYRRKVNYLASRVARTEMANAYGMSVYRKVEEDDGIIGVRWILSSGHPKPDECDHMAEVDAWGMGGGVYPSNGLPMFPAHSNCLCSFVSVREDPDNPQKNKRYSNTRVAEYLEGVGQTKRGQILGVGVAKKGQKEWIKALDKKGIGQPKDRPMTAKKVIKELQV